MTGLIQNNEVWRRLGEAHAENDRDDRAIAALTRATHIDAGYVSISIYFYLSIYIYFYISKCLPRLSPLPLPARVA
jgi:hypothetical protein